MTEFKLQLIYIGNIPNNYHAKDLRRFFKIFTETEKFHIFHFRHRPEISNFRGDLSNINLKPKRTNHQSLCSFCVIKYEDINLFLQYYNNKHWLSVDSNEPINVKCKIILSEKFNEIPSNLISKMIELKVPLDMINGNVGTSLKWFFNANMNCRLSINIMKKLGLDFITDYKLNKYNSIPYNYENPYKKLMSDYVGHHSYNLMDDEEYFIYLLNKEKKGNVSEPFSDTDETSYDYTATQDDELEEWERFELLHGDAHDLDRNGNCTLEYEKEQEVTWEKGGPGMVLYTDQAFWRDEENKDTDDVFDEPGNWDFDIDTSHIDQCIHAGKYFERKDKKKYKAGILTVSKRNKNHLKVSKTAVKIMQSLGWKGGQSLGADISKGIKSFGELFPNDFSPQSKEQSGLSCRNKEELPTTTICTHRENYYGADKNIRITYFGRFIKSRSE